MALDQLFEAFRAAAIDNIDGPGQEAAVDKLNAIKRIILQRPGYLDRYRDFLAEPESSVRLSAAISVKDADPKAAIPVFKELLDGHYGLGTLAWIELRELRLRGYV